MAAPYRAEELPMTILEETGATRSPKRSSGSLEQGRRRGSSDAPTSEAEDEEDDVDAFIAAHESPLSSKSQYLRPRLFTSFLIFGLLNNVLYVIILSAALDLVGAETPKGVVALFNIFPALLAKVGWPLISNGKIRYGRRVAFCTIVSWLGIITIAFSSSVPPRLFGISLASLSSGLGELTFLQMTTTYPSRAASRTALGAWSSGTGAAGIAGAGLWWLLRGLGVKGGLGISSFLPLFFPFTYIFLLPPISAFQGSGNTYQALATEDTIDTSDPALQSDGMEEDSISKKPITPIRLSTNEKLTMIRGLLLRYMLPLGLVYTAEYMINSGVAPTLVFPVPNSGIWTKIIHSPRDYYPFWSLTYQTFVFISRSSLSLGLPPLPLRLLPLPTIIQTLNLLLLSLQASHFIFSSSPPSPSPSSGPISMGGGEESTITKVFLLICLEGLCGGAAYVNAFYHVGRIGDDGEGKEDDDSEEGQRRKMEREFRIGATGGADSCGILLASLLSMPLETSLCTTQVERGRTLCRDL